MLRRVCRFVLPIAGVLVLFIFLNNTNLFSSRPPGLPTLLAHRGMAQDYDRSNLTGETCTAARMVRTDHEFIENTIPSMQAAFDAGASIVELDIHPTTDGHFAVFHDWTVDCRTNGHGVTREQPMTVLRTLDVGYGYTADGGKTFPFRGRGVGLMPTLEEVLAHFPDKRFLIHLKSANDITEAERLAAFIATLPAERRALLSVYGGGIRRGNETVMALKRLQPDLRVMSGASLRTCVIEYIAYGWTGLMPETCHNTMVLLPVNIAPWLWGWPNRLLDRFESAGTQVFLVGPYGAAGGGGFSTGLNSPEALTGLPQHYSGGIWTDAIGLVAPLLGNR